MAAEPSTPGVGLDYVIPAYRAISPTAVVALLLGLLSVASFVEPTFFVAAALAIVVGLAAERTIRRMPEVYTGRGLAQAGVALGMVFGLAAGTNMAVNGMIVRRGAASFGREVASVFESGQLDQVVNIKIPYSSRKDLKPGEAMQRLKDAASKSPDIYESEVGPSTAILDRVKGGVGHVAFDAVETTAQAGVVPIAGVRLRVTAPATPKQPAESYAWVELKGEPATGRWYLSNVKYPYQPKSVALEGSATSKKGDDDGHGHSH